MKKSIVIFFLVSFCLSTAAFSSQFYSCKGKYALCTTAVCKPIAGKKNLVDCSCSVLNGYSVGTKQCQPVKKTNRGELVHSRYYPIKSYVACNNSRPWAWCLDKECFIDKKHPSKASCICTTVRNQGTYIIVTSKATATTCTTGIISSATVKDANETTAFIKTQKAPKVYPIKILKN